MHKAILVARSPVWEFSLNWLVKSLIVELLFQVFKAMFQPGIGMTEAQTGRVEIKEIGTRLCSSFCFQRMGLDPEVLEEMLRFVYTGLVKHSLEARILFQIVIKI